MVLTVNKNFIRKLFNKSLCPKLPIWWTAGTNKQSKQTCNKQRINEETRVNQWRDAPSENSIDHDNKMVGGGRIGGIWTPHIAAASIDGLRCANLVLIHRINKQARRQLEFSRENRKESARKFEKKLAMNWIDLISIMKRWIVSLVGSSVYLWYRLPNNKGN